MLGSNSNGLVAASPVGARGSTPPFEPKKMSDIGPSMETKSSQDSFDKYFQKEIDLEESKPQTLQRRFLSSSMN